MIDEKYNMTNVSLDRNQCGISLLSTIIAAVLLASVTQFSGLVIVQGFQSSKKLEIKEDYQQ